MYTQTHIRTHTHANTHTHSHTHTNTHRDVNTHHPHAQIATQACKGGRQDQIFATVSLVWWVACRYRLEHCSQWAGAPRLACVCACNCARAHHIQQCIFACLFLQLLPSITRHQSALFRAPCSSALAVHARRAF